LKKGEGGSAPLKNVDVREDAVEALEDLTVGCYEGEYHQ
jgi:hypothetical protein